MNIIKSKIDRRIYKYLKLDNDLEAILIHDDQTEQSAVSLTVHVGYYNDPKEYPGLAHFLEHMLFMGTKKYKSENYFFDFINKAGGTTNAMTSDETTSYYFDIQSTYLEQGIDIFSQFFINPLFKKDTIMREINAIDLEYLKNKNIESFRLNMIIKTIADPNSPYSCFGAGNIDTLKKKDIRKQLIKFYKTYYSSNLMKLVIISNHSMDEIERIVKKYFSLIKNNHFDKKSHTIYPFDLTKTIKNTLCYKLVKIVPIMDQKVVNIFWQLPYKRKNNYSKSIKYIIHMLKHETEGSIFNLLKKNNFSIDSSVVIYDQDDISLLLCMSIILTNKGFSYLPSIIDNIYLYIKKIKQDGIKKWIYDELKIMGQINFDYMEKINNLEYVFIISNNLLYFPPKYLLYSSYYFEPYSDIIEKEIKYYLNFLKKKYSIITISSKFYEKIVTKKEKWYEGKYQDWTNVFDLGDEFKKEDIILGPLLLPYKNIYIPEQIQILKLDVKHKYPIKIFKTTNIEIWFKQDYQFGSPNTLLSIIFESEEIYRTVQNYVIMKLYTKLLEIITLPDKYYAAIANSMNIIDVNLESLLIHIDSYYDKIDIILDRIFENLIDLKFDESIYNHSIEYLKNELINFIYQPSLQKINEYFYEKIFNKYYTFEELLEVLEQITYQDFKNRFKKDILFWLQKSYIKVLIQGNITRYYIVKLIEKFKFLINNNNIPSNKGIIKLIPLTSGEEELYLRKQFLRVEDTSIINVFFEIGYIKKGVTKKWKRILSCILMIEILIRENFFYQLRTKEQLGYVVRTYVHYLGNIKNQFVGISFLIQSKKSPYILRKRIKSFVEDSTKYINKLNNSKFNDFKIILKNDILQKDNNIYEEFKRNIEEIMRSDYLFDYKEKLANELDKISKRDISKFYKKYFIDKRTRKIRIIEIYR